MRLFQDRIEHGLEVAGGAVDDLQYLGARGLLGERLVTLGFALVTLGPALSKLTMQIGYELLGTGERAVGRRAHLRTSSGPTFRADHTVIEAGHHRLPIGTISGLSD